MTAAVFVGADWQSIVIMSTAVKSRSADKVAVVSMHELLRSLAIVTAVIVGATTAAAAAERRSELIRYGDVQIEVVVDGAGPAVVLLPSLARNSDDYDAVAEGLAAAGFLVLRPKPRGIGRSTGPMTEHHVARSGARHRRDCRKARRRPRGRSSATRTATGSRG